MAAVALPLVEGLERVAVLAAIDVASGAVKGQAPRLSLGSAAVIANRASHGGKSLPRGPKSCARAPLAGTVCPVSYAVVRGLGLSANLNIQAEIQGKLPPIPGGMPMALPSDTLNQIIQSSPAASSIASDWGPALDAVASSGIRPEDIAKSPGKATQVMITALPMVMDAAGIGGTPSDIAQVAAGFAPQVGQLIDGKPGPLVLAGIKTGAAYGCKELGIPPDIANITIDSIAEGEISQKTLEAAGGLGGAVGGAALCSLIGIPPCIGGFVGGQAGKLLGGALSDLLHIGIGKADREAQRQARLKLESAMRGELSALRTAYINMTLGARGTWWANLDHIIDNVSMQWQAIECAGFPPNPSGDTPVTYGRMPLLWSGIGTVNPFFLYPFSASTCARPLNQNLSRGTGCLNSKGLLSSVTELGCRQPYGCPYPSFPALGAGDWEERVVQALAAYDIWWVPPPGRKAIDDQWASLFPVPDARPRDPNVYAHVRHNTWVGYLANLTETRGKCTTNRCKAPLDQEHGRTLEWYKSDLAMTSAEALSMEAISAAMMRISGDLATTAGIYAAAGAINANRTALAQGNLSRALAKQKDDASLIMRENGNLSKAIAHGRHVNSITNYGMLAMGALLLGKAVLGGKSR